MKTIVIGAGPAGLTAAYVLSKQAHKVQVFEASNTVAGMARSFELWGQIVDLGPHRFHSRERLVNELWLEVAGREYIMIARQTRILYEGKFFAYPLEVWDAMSKLGPVECIRSVASYARQRVQSNAPNETFEGWMTKRFGRRLYEIFFKSYSEKLWGIPCTELDADFAVQRIKQLSLSEAIKAAIAPRVRAGHRTLVDKFAFPIRGTGSIYERMAAAVQERGDQVSMNSPVRKVLVKKGKVVGVDLASGVSVPCERVISSMPLTVMVRQLEGAPMEVIDAANHLRFRNTVIVYLEILNSNPFPDQWIYVHDPNLRFGRVTNFRNWAPQLCGDSPHSILAMEYWCDPDCDFWEQDDAKLAEIARGEILESGLVADQEKLGRFHVVRVPKCYPIYRCGYRRHLEIIRDYLKGISGLQAIGRYGAFKYNNQDHSILMGLLAAENVLGKGNHDLWSINADRETYQEGCAITETGLASASYAESEND